MRKHSSILLLLALILCCEQKISKTDSEIYTEHSIKLIKDIIAENENLCDCILEPSSISPLKEANRNIQDFNYELRLRNALKLNKDYDLNELHGINDTLFLKPNPFSSKSKIIYIDEWRELIAKYDGNNAQDTIYKIYPNLCAISKPIFDKDYKIVLLKVNSVYSHMRTHAFPLQLKNGKWQYVD